MRRLARKAGRLAGALAALYLLIALGLALVPPPRLTHPLAARVPPSPPCRESTGFRCFAMRDGFVLAARRTPASAPGGSPVALLQHGVLSSGAELEETASNLRTALGAEVLRLDLRGHGLSARAPATRKGVADVDHLDQYAEDVADVLSTLRRERPHARILLAGHSMGGGIALRYAQLAAQHAGSPGADAYLLAPHLGERSPTARTAPKDAEAHGDSILKIALPRIVGLAMLNAVRFRGLNGFQTLFFDLPFDLPVKAYTFRAMASMAPDDYRAALQADDKPMLVLVGEEDEAFQASAYPQAVALHRHARTVLVPGASHDGICRDPRSFAAIRSWMVEWANAG